MATMSRLGGGSSHPAAARSSGVPGTGSWAGGVLGVVQMRPTTTGSSVRSMTGSGAAVTTGSG
eukprot:3598289-Heterocapsa_arctica.AAC.1